MKRSTKILFSTVGSILVLLGFAHLAFAQPANGADIATIKATGMAGSYGYLGIAAGIGLGLAALGGGLGQGRAAAAALDGIARNPGARAQIFTPMLIGLALIESLVIYALIISFILVGKIGS
jgi:F-type H+-transporting ATPase subunit c